MSRDGGNAQGRSQARGVHVPKNTTTTKQRKLLQKSYKEEHFGLEHHGDGSRRGNGGSAWRDGEAELDIPFKLSGLIRELRVKDT